MGNAICDACGKEEDPFREDRFWCGTWKRKIDGVVRELRTLCNDCHRDLVRNHGR